MRSTTRTTRGRHLPNNIYNSRLPPPITLFTSLLLQISHPIIYRSNLPAYQQLLSNWPNLRFSSKNTYIFNPSMTPQGPCRGPCSRVNNPRQSPPKIRSIRIPTIYILIPPSPSLQNLYVNYNSLPLRRSFNYSHMYSTT